MASSDVLRPPGETVERTRTLPTWQAEMRSAVRRLDDLLARLDLSPGDLAAAENAFPVFVPPSFLSRIRPGDPHDPLLRQVAPLAEEAVAVPGFSHDPLLELGQEPPNLLRKYQGRALLVATGACAVHCRYCFRRAFPYDQSPATRGAWRAALEAIRDDETIEEVLLSGGDPLTIADEPLARLLREVAAIPHVARLRIHTRTPIVIPARVTVELTFALASLGKPVVVVVHCNHAQEIDAATAAALSRLKGVATLLLNQAVLLRGVNDSVEALVALSQRLVDCGVAPYYLHQLDRVAGAAHFEVSEEQGRQLVGELARRLPGYAVPKYVRETPGEAAKSPIV